MVPLLCILNRRFFQLILIPRENLDFLGFSSSISRSGQNQDFICLPGPIAVDDRRQGEEGVSFSRWRAFFLSGFTRAQQPHPVLR
jgi:hypothetical protein